MRNYSKQKRSLMNWEDKQHALYFWMGVIGGLIIGYLI